jgi:hypothetical protein
MGKIDWDVVTNFTDAVTTTLKTVTFPKVQEQVYLRNQGNANFTYTIGSQSGTLTPGQSVTVNQDVSSFTLQAVSGTHTFELRAKEKGTEQTEPETDVMSLLAEKVNYLTPEMYGAKGDGVTDDTTALQNAINDATSKAIELRLSNKTYVTTAPLILKNYLMLSGNYINDEYSKGSMIKNTTTNMFTSGFDSTAGLYKLIGVKLSGICFIGSSTTKLFDDVNIIYLYWSQINSCGFRNFFNLFNGLKATGCWFKNIFFNKGLAVGKISGSDNTFSDWFVSVDEENINRQSYMFNLDNMMLSKFDNMFLTGSLQVGKGVKKIFYLKASTVNVFNRIYFDYCDEQALYLEVNSANNVFTACSFRGAGRDPSTVNEWILVKTGSNNNVFTNNQFSPSTLTDETNANSRFYDIQSDALNTIISDNAYNLQRRHFRNVNATTKVFENQARSTMLNQTFTTDLIGTFNGNYVSFPQTIPASGTKDLTFTLSNLELQQVLYKAYLNGSSADLPTGITIKKCRATASGITITLKNSLATDVILNYVVSFDVYCMY